MSTTVCPLCLVRVTVRRDGTCPACREVIETEDMEALEDYEVESSSPPPQRRSRRERPSSKSIECPACAEMVSSTHDFCPHCGEGLNENASSGVWRDGKTLVFEKGARLPNRCIKSNEPADRYIRRDLTWAPPWVYLGIFGGVLLIVVFYLIARKTAVAEFGITQEWVKRRRKRIALVWLLCLFGFGLVIAGATVENWAVLLGGVVIWVGALIYAVVAVPFYYVQRIDDRYVWLKGIHPHYLAELPEFYRI